MPEETRFIYVKRSPDGEVEDVSIHHLEGYVPLLALDGSGQPLPPQPPSPGKFDALAATDLPLVRVVEDLVDLMVSRKMINFADLPLVAQEKLRRRRAIRDELDGSIPLDCEED